MLSGNEQENVSIFPHRVAVRKRSFAPSSLLFSTSYLPYYGPIFARNNKNVVNKLFLSCWRHLHLTHSELEFSTRKAQLGKGLDKV